MGTSTEKPKKALIYSPYLDTLGGGERYILTVAELLLSAHWQVDLAWSKDQSLVKKAASRFSLNLHALHFVPDIFHHFPFYKRYLFERHYDLIFYLSDGSIPWLFAKKNFIHFQVPFLHHQSDFQALLTFHKFLLVTKIICNSCFTERFIRHTYRTKKTEVWYPPVDIQAFKSTDICHKKNIILAVGRFDEHTLNTKRQDVLIETFKVLVDKGLRGWQFVLAGNSLNLPAKNNFLHRLKKLATGYPITFAVNCPYRQLKNYYLTSRIFWHAAGFGINEKLRPEFTEHFGITTVEAMAAGAVPLVVNKGGLSEIVQHNTNGFLWQSPKELANYTLSLIKNPKLYTKLQHRARLSAPLFSKEKFRKKLFSCL